MYQGEFNPKMSSISVKPNIITKVDFYTLTVEEKH